MDNTRKTLSFFNLQVMLPTDTAIDNAHICRMKGITHVVTSITYGMDAYMTFKKEDKTKKSKEIIAGELKVKPFV